MPREGGIAGGMISSLVGGAALVTYPALLSMGLPPVVAVIVIVVGVLLTIEFAHRFWF